MKSDGSKISENKRYQGWTWHEGEAKKQWWGTQLWTWIKSNHHKKNHCNSI